MEIVVVFPARSARGTVDLPLGNGQAHPGDRFDPPWKRLAQSLRHDRVRHAWILLALEVFGQGPDHPPDAHS